MNLFDVGAPIDIIVNELTEYEELKKDSYLIYKTISIEGIVIYDKRVVLKTLILSFPRKRESSIDAVFWIPACAGMTVIRTTQKLKKSKAGSKGQKAI